MGRKFDVAAWAKQVKRINSCGTCRLPEVAEAISVILDMMRAGDASVTVTDIHEMLVREFDYPYIQGDVFILHSDGVSTRFEVDEEWARDPGTDLQKVAEEIVENYGKDNDDVTIIVVR